MAEVATIRAIDAQSVHRIHSGQVVLELQGAIKELVENSLDAGATSIEVRIKDNGLEGIEVIDNGSGIAEADWPFIALKHHTSKLPDLDLLPEVTTFGFRGEALSALCALCESITITTATKESAPMGAVIKLARDGSILDSSGRIARPRGTTISLTGLFTPLPVRRKEFERNAKREITKALTLLTAYALVPASVTEDGSTGVRLKVESANAGKAGKRNTLLVNDGRGNLRASVTSIWGTKALEGVQDVDLSLEVEIDPRARRQDTDTHQIVRVVGLISSAAWGQGRSSSDRQFFFVNGRPCDLKPIQKMLNEVYKTFNTHQMPLVVLDFRIPRDSVDINVSPDKRTIMLHSEANLLAALRTQLEEFFAPSRSSFVVEGATQTVRSLRSGMTQSKISESFALESQVEKEGVDELEEEEGEVKRTNPPAVNTDDASESFGETEEDEAEIVEKNSADIETEEGDEEAHEEAEGIKSLGPRSSTNRQSSSSRPVSSLPTPSRSISKRAGKEPVVITQLDEDASEGEEEQDQPSEPTKSTLRPVLPTFRRRADVGSPLSAPAIAESSTAKRVKQTTVSTSQASWSPERKKHHTASNGSTQATPPRKRLRERLAAYASQGSRPLSPATPESEGEDEVMEQIPVAEEEEAEKSSSNDEEVDELAEPDADEDQDGIEDGSQPARGITSGINSRSLHEPIFTDEIESPTEPASLPEKGDPRGSKRIRNTVRSPLSSRTASPELPIPPRPPTESLPSTSTLRHDSSSYRGEITASTGTGSMTLKFDLPRLKARYTSLKRTRPNPATSPKRDAFSAIKAAGVADAAGIRNKDTITAEAALSRVISKDDFSRMEVLGQFNKGFIITRLKKKEGDLDDLFIVDQHASDEKYNFETLQRTTVIKAQNLIKPRLLELTAGDEMIAMENLDVLRANGFEVGVDEDKPPGRGERISLIAMPVSKETTFDFKDLEQLLYLLSDGARPAGQMVRCSKARSMFAMRACRKSVMIGKSLTKNQMLQLLRNMGTIDQPWNCPHGRPTMRHLTKIEVPTKSRSGKGRIDWSKWET